MNVFEALRQDHEVQRDLLDRLEDTQGAEELRKQNYAMLKDELSQHAAAEEKCFYAQLMSVDLTQEKARHSVAEHKDMDDLVEELSDIEYSSPQWLQKFKELKHMVTHHLDEEEQEVFQMAGKALTDKQKEDLGKQYRNEMERHRKAS
ncbi:hemerythrin domain-containing protein [Marinobacter lipolyticus]|uniref:hemerythrin domain-containing protein n=1 Tax=Marinobacter lipolyticus TaxID=209639 RepID=UPI001BCB5010|nr:hemerythrin domain-containing protein [Marinobacter lipolyticus]MBS8241381.1 hemerythrin domain-containing protein [Marinobacter lipolyticus]